MSRLVTPLTSVQIKNAKPKEKAYKLFDGGGLFLQVMPTGSKLWRMKYRQIDGKENLLSFGKFPDVSLEQARQRREETRKLKAQGIDPSENRKAKQAEKKAENKAKDIEDSNTFERIARRLYESKQGRTTDDYRNTMLRQFELHLFPAIGTKNISAIEGRELFELLKTVADKTNSRGKPMTYMAKKLCQWSAEVYDLANVENSGFNLNNPCRSIIKFLPKHETEHMARIGFDELSQFIQALQNYGGHVLTRAAIWMLLYTGMRQTSVRHAQWNDFDLDKGTVRVTKSLSRIGGRDVVGPPKTRQSYRVVTMPGFLTDEVGDYFSWNKGSNPTDRVLPKVTASTLGKALARGARGAGLRRIRVHDLRHSHAPMLIEKGFSVPAIAARLGHSGQEITHRYMHPYSDSDSKIALALDGKLSV